MAIIVPGAIKKSHVVVLVSLATAGLAASGANLQDPVEETKATAKAEVVGAEVESEPAAAAKTAQDEPAGGEAEKTEVVKKEAVKQRVIELRRLFPGGRGPAREAPAEENEDDLRKLDPEAMQYVQQLRPILRAELHRLRRAAEPTDEQMKAIAAESWRALHAAARAVARQMRGGMVGQDAVPDPVATIGAEMVKIAQPHLNPRQHEAYRAEHERLRKRQKRAAIRLMVAALDEDLRLTAEQRAAIERGLDEKWTEGMVRALAVAQFGRQYVPLPPDPVVEPILNPRQKTIWSQRKRNQQQIYGFFWYAQIENRELEPLVDAEAMEAGRIGEAVIVAPAEVVETRPAEESAEAVAPEPADKP